MITPDIILSFLNCPRKAFLKRTGVAGIIPDIERVRNDLDQQYRERALEAFIAESHCHEWNRHPRSPAEAIETNSPFLFNLPVSADRIASHIYLAERDKDGGQWYAPVRFVRHSRIDRTEKLLLAFDAFVLAAVQNHLPATARIIYGPTHKSVRVKLEPFIIEVQKLVVRIEALLTETTGRQLTLIRHCNECQFQEACQQAAADADDISLLHGMSEKEITRERNRGILTVAQFSYSYRPGRRGKNREGKARRHDHALQALAIREKKVYLVDKPVIPNTGSSLYLDVEGDPERDFYYLIGLVLDHDGQSTRHSFWADNPSQQAAIWRTCASVIQAFHDYTLFHYGRYELRFLDRMKELNGPDEGETIDRIRARCCNVVGLIHSHIYFPTHSNSLKEIGRYLGALWTSPKASGIQSIAWRAGWEASHDESLKSELVRYNLEDCVALQRVTEVLRSICGPPERQAEQPSIPVALASDRGEGTSFWFSKQEFFCPDLADINKRAYSEYQREKVYFRTSPAVRKSLRRKQQRHAKKKLRINQYIECQGPKTCPFCGSPHVHLFRGILYRKIICDLRFGPSGVRRWIIQYMSKRYRCWKCRKTFYADEYRKADCRQGNNLASWAVYHHVALRQSFVDIAESLNDIFGFRFGELMFGRVKRFAVARWSPAYEALKARLREGDLIHADETKVRGRTGYVWAFTNMEEVVYEYRPSREGSVLDDILDGFLGVLVSDFYSVYDSVPCKQQKCLIHLARDINDDLFHHPFDEELKGLAQVFVGILRPIINTIDRFGLKQRFLNRHKPDVARFLKQLDGAVYRSEVATKYQKRCQKYRGSLFTFLDHDGVPWNNNNAEVAIKLFASRRRLIGTSYSEKGIQDYLVFLSIFQTCRQKQVSFLRFLLSGLADIDTFVKSL